MKFLKVAFRSLLRHGRDDHDRPARGAPWCRGEHSNVHVRQPRSARTDTAGDGINPGVELSLDAAVGGGRAD